MNLYRIIAPNVAFHEVVDPEYGGPYWHEDVDAYVLAETRGKARAFLRSDLDIDAFTYPCSITLVRRNVECADTEACYCDDEFVWANPDVFPEWYQFLEQEANSETQLY